MMLNMLWGGHTSRKVMSIILGVTYSDLFAAIGVAAGGEYPAATNPMSAGIGEVFGGQDPTRQGQGASMSLLLHVHQYVPDLWRLKKM